MLVNAAGFLLVAVGMKQGGAVMVVGGASDTGVGNGYPAER